MSNLVFPLTLPGWDINVTRIEVFATKIQTAASGKELRAAWWSTPRFKYSVNLNFARQFGFSAQTLTDEVATLTAFFSAHKGAWDSFWLSDPMVPNLVKNPFTTDVNPSGFEAAGIANNAWGVNIKCRFVAGAGAATYGNQLFLTDKIPCAVGDLIHFEGDGVIFIGNDGQIIFSVAHYDADGTYLGSTNTTYNTVWNVPARLKVDCSALGAYVAFSVNTYGMTVGKTGYFNNFCAIRLDTAGLSTPPDGVSTRITTDLTLQRRVRFDGDELELQRIANLAWTGSGTINLISTK